MFVIPVKDCELYQHQHEAFCYICDMFGIDDGLQKSKGVALLMEMGTGKTVVSIATIGILYQMGLITRALIIAPLSVLNVWESELEKFAAYPYNITVLNGSSQKKAQQLHNLKGDTLQIVAVNYESARLLENELLKFSPELVIADEGHKIKNFKASQSKTLHRLGDVADYKLLLTGTVITNKELDIFSQYRFVSPNIFGKSFYVFRNRYFDMVGYGGHIPRFRKSMLDEFLLRIHSVAFRVTKAECLDLPPFSEEERLIDLEPKAKKLYQSLQKQSFAQLDDSSVSAVNVLTKCLRLSQLSGGFFTDDDGAVTKISDAKLNALEDIIDTAVADNEKIVVMARFNPELDAIEKLLQKKGINYVSIRGGSKNRSESLDRFQNDDNCSVFVGQISAAGLGLTLTAASTMVFYSLSYSMSDYEQAKARIHRAGQKKSCNYIYLICKDTIDTKVLKALKQKNDLAKQLIDDYRNGINPFD